MLQLPLTPTESANLLLAYLRISGGAGSGNFGHSGRPGQKGGSGRIVYHGTMHDRVEGIKREGLKRALSGTVYKEISRENIVYVTTDPLEAKGWAESTRRKLELEHFRKHPGPDSKFEGVPVILEIEIPKAAVPYLRFDRNLPGTTDSFEFARDVDPKWIKGVKVRTENPVTGNSTWRAAASAEDLIYIAVILFPDSFRVAGSASSGHHGHLGRKGFEGGSTSRTTASLVPISDFKDKSLLRERLKALVVPPAWTDVRINLDSEGQLQATGVDKKGRTQYRYSAQHSEEAAAEKFARLKDFDRELPRLRDQIAKDTRKGVEPAAVLQLIDKTGFRIGSDQDTKADKKAFGASTMLSKHVRVSGDKVTFKFIGKKGVEIRKTLVDKDLAANLSGRISKGEKLFNASDRDVRDYLNSHAEGFTPKDFRTWYATDRALKLITAKPIPKSMLALKKAQKEVAKAISEDLGNTPTVTMKSYIDPAAWTIWKVK